MAEPIARVAARGALITGGAQFLRAALTIATTVIVARLVTPDDYGVVAMAAPVLAFALLFQDFGLSAATIQADEITERQSSTLFWVNMMISLGIAILMLAAAPAIAWFYGDPRVGYVTAAFAAVVLVTSAALQHGALLNREMRFGAMAAVAIAGAVAGFAVTVAAAFLLENYWALLLGILATAVVQLVVTWGVKRWVPALHLSVREARPLLGFGGSVAGFGICNFLSRNADDILIGKVWGAGSLGLYDRSYRLMLAPLQMVNAPLSKVMLPVLSRLRDEPERYRNAYLNSLQLLLLIVAPVAAVGVAFSGEVVHLLLGSQWESAAPIFFWLAIGAMYQPIGHSAGWLLMSSGRGADLFRWGVFASVTTVFGFAAAVSWGPEMMAMVYVIIGLIRLPILIYWSCRETKIKPLSIGKISIPAIVSTIALIGFSKAIPAEADDFLVIAFGLGMSFCICWGLVFLSSSGRTFFREVAGHARSLLD